METIDIRKAGPDDTELLQQISRKTFYETFAGVNTEANMRRYLEEALSIAKLATELQDEGAAFYFAWQGKDIIGYLKLNFGMSQTELLPGNGTEIERIYVLREYHGQAVGRLLYEKAVEVATAKGADYIWLGVWEENPRAIRFYEKNGFVAFDKHTFMLGDDAQTDIMMKLVLKNG